MKKQMANGNSQCDANSFQLFCSDMNCQRAWVTLKQNFQCLALFVCKNPPLLFLKAKTQKNHELNLYNRFHKWLFSGWLHIFRNLPIQGHHQIPHIRLWLWNLQQPRTFCSIDRLWGIDLRAWAIPRTRIRQVDCRESYFAVELSIFTHSWVKLLILYVFIIHRHWTHSVIILTVSIHILVHSIFMYSFYINLQS